jgi:DNA-directed RNA polymerase beta subunit
MITNQTERLNFASTKNIPAYPDFLDVQVKSFQDFFQLKLNLMKEAMKDLIPSWKIFQLQIQEITLYGIP